MTKAMTMLLLHGTNVVATVVQGHMALAFHLEVCKLLEEACHRHRAVGREATKTASIT